MQPPGGYSPNISINTSFNLVARDRWRVFVPKVSHENILNERHLAHRRRYLERVSFSLDGNESVVASLTVGFFPRHFLARLITRLGYDYTPFGVCTRYFFILVFD